MTLQSETTQASLNDYHDNLPRDSAVIVRDDPVAEKHGHDLIAFAQTIRGLGRKVVVISERFARASGLTIVPNWEELERQWQQIGAPEARFIGFDPAVQGVAELLCEKSALNYTVSFRRAKHWAEHTIQNLDYLAMPSLMRMQGRYRGVPCYVVGCGPSLEKNLHLLERAAQHGIVIAVNAASKLLPVAPHVTMTIESEDTRSLIGDTRGSIRAISLCCDPRTFLHGSGPVSPVYQTNPSGVVDILTGIERLECSISVSTAALSLARLMGCSPLVLVGQDLAYTDLKLYADGAGGGTVTTDGQVQWGRPQRELPRTQSGLPTHYDVVEWPAYGNTDATVHTNRDYQMILQYLAHGAKEWPKVGHECIDATEGGAKKPGWTERALADVLATSHARPPTPAELAVDMVDAGPLATRDQLRDFRLGQAWLAASTETRARSMSRLVTALNHEPAGSIPGSISELMTWMQAPSEWVAAHASERLYEVFEPYRRTPFCTDEAEERKATREALGEAAQVIQDSAMRVQEMLRD